MEARLQALYQLMRCYHKLHDMEMSPAFDSPTFHNLSSQTETYQARGLSPSHPRFEIVLHLTHIFGFQLAWSYMHVYPKMHDPKVRELNNHALYRSFLLKLVSIHHSIGRRYPRQLTGPKSCIEGCQ